MRRIIALVLLTAALAVGPLAAQEQYLIRIDSRVGFSGLFKPGRWTPVELTLQNLGPGVSGTLTVELTRRDRLGPNRQSNTYERNLDLASGAVKSFSFVVPLETGVYPLVVRIEHQGEVVDEQEVKLAGRGVTNSLVAVLSRGTSLDFLLPVFNSHSGRSLDLVYPLIDYLPDEWHGYDGIDLLVVHDARIQALGTDQIAAIRDWVAAGGRLVVSAGAHLGPADAAVMEQLTGLRVSAVDVLPVGEVGLQEVGLPVVPEEIDSEAVVSRFANAESVVSYSRFGQGDIVVLPFDFTQFVRVAPVTSLGMWTSLLPEHVVVPASANDTESASRTGLVPISVNRRAFETDILANQLDLPLYNFPGRWLVGGLVLSFVLAAVALFIWSSRQDSRGRTAAGVAAVVVLAVMASVVSHLTLTVGQQPPEALELSLEMATMGPDDGFAVVTRDIVLFSRQRADYSARLPDTTVIVPLDSRDLTVREEAGTRLVGLPVERWGHHNALAIQVSEFDLRAMTHRGIGYVNVELHNDSPMPLDGTVVLNNGFPSLIGEVRPGDVLEHVVVGSGVGRWDEIDWAAYVPEGDLSGHQAQLLRDIARRQRDGLEPALLVMAWYPAPLVNASVEPEFTRRIELNAVMLDLRAPAPAPEETTG